MCLEEDSCASKRTHMRLEEATYKNPVCGKPKNTKTPEAGPM